MLWWLHYRSVRRIQREEAAHHIVDGLLVSGNVCDVVCNSDHTCEQYLPSDWLSLDGFVLWWWYPARLLWYIGVYCAQELSPHFILAVNVGVQFGWILFVIVCIGNHNASVSYA